MPTDIPACGYERCLLPAYCQNCEGACLMHCGGSTVWWRALWYFLKVWWSLRSWHPRQGGWYVY